MNLRISESVFLRKRSEIELEIKNGDRESERFLEEI